MPRAPPITPAAAATRLQARQRGRVGRSVATLHYLAYRIERHYAAAAEQQQQLFDAELHSAPLMHGAVMRMEGRLLKQSGAPWGWQQRAARVDGFRFQYHARNGDWKSIDLAEVERVAIVSEERLEFAIHARARGGKVRAFRALNKQDFKSWTLGLRQYVTMAQAYYAM